MNRIIFLVDKELTVRMYYQEKLSLLGLEVLVSSEREHLLERIDRDRPDAIITDIQRWETIMMDPTCHYDLRSMESGYIIAQKSHSKGLNIILRAFGRKGKEHLELVLYKGDRTTRFLSEHRKLGELGPPGDVSLAFAPPKRRPELALLH